MHTERIAFSTWKEGDERLAQSLWGDEEVARFLCADGRFAPEAVRARLVQEMENQEKHGLQYWPIFLRQGGDFIGCCGLRPYGERVYEIGFHLLPAYWGKGLGEEAAQGAMAYAFANLGAQGLFAGHHPDNGGSERLLAKLGFRYVEDVLYQPTGRMHPSYRYEKGEERDS